MEQIFRDETRKLGFGLMRLPLLDANDVASINIEETKKMVDAFLAEGFTYFDTAWMYCGSQSEPAAKEVLTSRYPREAFTLATKLHCDFFQTKEEMDQIFSSQLEKTGVDYFDYYLLHDVREDHYKKYQEFSCFEWLQEKKKAGLVKHMGFSYHDGPELLDEILTTHPEVEFVQLQINYLDWENEGVQSRKCYEVCEKHQKPVIVMEPVKGGTLANVVEAAEALFKSHQEQWSVASWAIRFVASLPNVKMVLSGMSSLEMIQDNTGYMKEFQPLNEKEMSIVWQARDIINQGVAIPCTGCAYCVEGCPKNIPIPKYFSLYNAQIQDANRSKFTPQNGYYDNYIQNFGKASDCIGCGKCEHICPQNLSIRKNLQLVAEEFEG